ncbi:MAG: hydroxyethylthiazole kinase [Synergistaceae bacterium]|jgi:hydroxyethylthiazole kinase|nr:hydroxyethylthiazole kinase [Synergistaceae bacterium]
MTGTKLKDCAPEDLANAWRAIAAEKPLIFHITNPVATSLQANVCLAVGASPLMSQYPEETEELIGLARGFLVNLGSPAEPALAAVERGMKAAKNTGCFTLLDPVGYGASRFRVESTDRFLREHSFSIIKGNGGEISLLAGVGGATKGVDVLSVGDLDRGVLNLARKFDCLVCATGETDCLSDGETLVRVTGGSALLPFLSGSGCTAGTVMLAATAACGDAAVGALCGLVAMGIASERAEKRCSGSGTFAPCLIDELHRLKPEDFLSEPRRWSVTSRSL